MKDTQPLVSVIAVCYNHSRFVLECLESIRNQTYKNIQLIIIDDHSTDDSVAVIRDWVATHRVECVFVVHSENKGVCRTLNDALSHASGKYVASTSTDDVWMLDKLEHQVRQMAVLPEEVGVLYSDAWRMDQNGVMLPKLFIEYHRSFSAPPEGDILDTLIEGNFIPAMTSLIRRSCYVKVGRYDESLCYEDWDMWIRISRRYKFAFSPFISAKYRILPTSLIHTITYNGKDLETNFTVYAKCLKLDGVSAARRRWLKDKLGLVAEAMYKNRHKRRNSFLWKTLKFDARLRTLGMLIFSVITLRYNTFLDFDAWFARFRQKFESFAVK